MRLYTRKPWSLVTVLVCVVLGGPSPVLGQGDSTSSSMGRDSAILKGIVLEGDSTVDAATVVLHRVGPEETEEVESTPTGAGGEFQFLLPSGLPVEPDADMAGDVYFISVEYDGIVYFGRGITALEQLDSSYVVRVFRAEKVLPGGVSLPVEVRSLRIEFDGEDWIATDAFLIGNPGNRTLVAQQNGVVWSYPLPSGALEPRLGGNEMPLDAVTFEGGRVRVSAPLPPGGRWLTIRYQLEELSATIPAPGSTAEFELLIREPSPPLRVEGLEAVDLVAYEGATYRLYGGTELVDVNLTLVETADPGSPPLEWLALLATALLAAGGFFAYSRPRRRVYPGQKLSSHA